MPQALATQKKPAALAATKDSPRSIGRVLSVLDALTSFPRGASLTELALELKVPKSSLLVMLKAMQVSGHVAEEDKRYRLAAASFDLALRISGMRPRNSILRDAMQELWALTKETAVLTMIDRERKLVTYVDAIESPESVRYTVRIGISRGLHCTAAGLACLAFQTEDFIERYLAGPLERFTPNTITDPVALRQRLERIRLDCVAISRSEAVLNSIGIAAPVPGVDGRVDHALLIAAPTDRVEPRVAELSDIIRSVVAKATASMSHSG